MKKLFIIKTGITFDNTKKLFGDFDKWIIEKIGETTLEIVVINMHTKYILPSINECAGVIITGSHSMVTNEEPWSVDLEKWIPTLVKNKIPLLGICYGHQLIAKSMNGVSSYNKNGTEIGTINISLSLEAKDDELFKNFPMKFKAHTIHSQSVEVLPLYAVRLAYNAFDKNHAYRIGSTTWGVQFHPEYDENIMKSYINEVSKTKDLEVETLLLKVEQTQEANFVIKRFAQIVQKEVNK